MLIMLTLPSFNKVMNGMRWKMHRSSPTEVFCKNCVLKSLKKLTEKYLCWSLILIKLHFIKKWCSCVNFETLILKHLQWLLLTESWFFFLSGFSLTNIHDLQDNNESPLYYFHPFHWHLDKGDYIWRDI